MLAHYMSLILLWSTHLVDSILLPYKFSLSVSPHYRTSDVKRTLQVASLFLYYDQLIVPPSGCIYFLRNATWFARIRNCL
jgi:hypothetical protein